MWNREREDLFHIYCGTCWSLLESGNRSRAEKQRHGLQCSLGKEQFTAKPPFYSKWRKKWTVNPVTLCDGGNKGDSGITEGTFHRYLGILIECMRESDIYSDELEKKLNTLTKELMKPQQKIYSLTHCVISSIFHSFTCVCVGVEFIKSRDHLVRGGVGLEYPKMCPRKRSVRLLGYSSAYTVQLLRPGRPAKFCSSVDGLSAEVMVAAFLPRFY